MLLVTCAVGLSIAVADDIDVFLKIAKVLIGPVDESAMPLPSLTELTREGSQRVRLSAISALGACNPPNEEALAAVGTAIKERDEKVRTIALGVLRSVGQRAPAAVIPILEKALESEGEQRRKQSIMATLDGLKKTGE